MHIPCHRIWPSHLHQIWPPPPPPPLDLAAPPPDPDLASGSHHITSTRSGRMRPLLSHPKGGKGGPRHCRCEDKQCAHYYRKTCQRVLDQVVKHFPAAPQVPSSIPGWDEFRNRLVGGCVCASMPHRSLCRLGKKSPSLLGQGSGGFSVGD